MFIIVALVPKTLSTVVILKVFFGFWAISITFDGTREGHQ